LALSWGEDALTDYAQRHEAFRAWCAERAGFAAAHGWCGGAAMRRWEETAVEPFGPSTI